MVTYKQIVMVGLILQLISIAKPVRAESPTDPAIIQVFVDPRADKAFLESTMQTVFGAAAKDAFDVRVIVFDSEQILNWAPPQPLDLRDFTSGIGLFRGQKERERADEQRKRVQTARTSFGEYLRAVRSPSAGCARLLTAANEATREPFRVIVFLLSSTVCSSPKVTLRLPSDRRVILILGSGNDVRQAGDDCQLLRQMRRMESSFPRALLLTAASTDLLADAFSKPSAPADSSGVTIRGCDSQPERRAQVSVRTPIESPRDPSLSLRMLSPKHLAHVGPRVLFQGEGASPGETIYPVIRVDDNFWPQEFVTARDDGTFDGAIVVGRRFKDCNVTFELRLFGQVREPLSVGKPIAAWPKADKESLPIDVLRTEECGASN